jgi:alpha 1,2-mannosyltransferase
MFHEKNIEVPKYLVTHNGTQRWPLGYRHMCRFWSGGFLADDIIKNCDYVWRMDSDAFINKQISYDVFLNMIDNNIDYCYSNICQDDPEVCEGLNDLSMQHFHTNAWAPYLMYTTHVEIISIKRFSCIDYMSYFNAIDETIGFYLKRWGDAPIRYIAVNNLNFNKSKLAIEYFHGNDGSGRREQELNETQ